MSRENLHNLIERLSEDLGLSDLRLDSDLDACGFQVDSKLDVLIEFDSDTTTAMFTVTVGTLPEENRLAFALDLLDANFYGVGSGGGTLATNSDLGTVYLQVKVPTDTLDQQRLHELLQGLVNNAEVWRDRLDNATTRAGTEAAASANEPEMLSVPGLTISGLV